jgi:hypothetical protein
MTSPTVSVEALSHVFAHRGRQTPAIDHLDLAVP